MTTAKKEQSFAKSLGKPKDLGKCVGGQGMVGVLTSSPLQPPQKL